MPYEDDAPGMPRDPSAAPVAAIVLVAAIIVGTFLVISVSSWVQQQSMVDDCALRARFSLSPFSQGALTLTNTGNATLWGFTGEFELPNSTIVRARPTEPALTATLRPGESAVLRFPAVEAASVKVIADSCRYFFATTNSMA